MLRIKNISKEYVTGSLKQMALDGVSLDLRDSEFVAVLGPSGSGKTTLLNIIGGLDRYDSGDLIINGITTKEYKDRDWDSYRNHTIGFVFQSYNLIPHQNILSNVELALTISGISKGERARRAKDALDKVGLTEHINKKPNQLSGGQMQRVAIARALVNDPDILLADEPTGALDSETSVQVMDLLKEVAEDRLVVMVTHNPELAEKYATRIVNLKDGKIVGDSNPLSTGQASGIGGTPIHKNLGKASMSFLTALALSFNNLLSKKTRTILVSFAGSIGIIGIALILSLSNGVNKYIEDTEQETLSEYPLQIQKTSLDLASFMGMAIDTEENVEGEVKERRMVSDMFSTMDSNDLSSLKTYLDSSESHIYDYAKSVEYTYNITPWIYRLEEKNMWQVSPDTTVTRYGASQDLYSMMGVTTSYFNQLPEDSELYVDQYDVVAGKWPENSSEAILVLMDRYHISDYLLYILGIKDMEEFNSMMKDFADEKPVEVSDDKLGTYSYDDFMGISFKVVPAYQRYSYDSKYDLWTDKSDDKAYLRDLAEKGRDLIIVGVAVPKENSRSAMLSPGIEYPGGLIYEMIEEAEESDIVKAQKANSKRNVISGKNFADEDDDNSFDMASLFNIDENAFANAFSFNTDGLSLDMSGLNFGNLNDLGSFDLGDLSNVEIQGPGIGDLSKLLEGVEIDLTEEEIAVMVQEIFTGYQKAAEDDISDIQDELQERMEGYISSGRLEKLIRSEMTAIIQGGGTSSLDYSAIAGKVMDDVQDYLKDNPITVEDTLQKSLEKYLSSEEAQKNISDAIGKAIDTDKIQKKIEENISSMFMGIMNEYAKTINSTMNSYASKIQGAITEAMSSFATQFSSELSKQLGNAFDFDSEALTNAFKFEMSEQELEELMTSLMTTEGSSYEGNLRKFGYADLAEPYAISIYPIDFESKNGILNILDDYNQNMENSGEKEKVVRYTDIVGTLMSSVTDIINSISYVLIAFVAISLVVSSIMIGVITYISVLERQKEIGILRAIGASKRNISGVFNAETFIIGLLAGLFGVGIARLLLIPGNQILHAFADSNDINAVLPIGAAGFLIALSIVLTLIGGLIPSRKAAKSDPVTALRTE